MVLSGCVGPRGDGYKPGATMSVAEAERYHAEQIRVFAETEADMIGAFTMNYVEEAIGIARAADAAGMPVAISFTLETDGRLPTGETLKEAIVAVDRATGGAPAYFMINCAHPTHFAGGARTRTKHGSSASAASAPMPRSAATRSSTQRPISMPAIRPSSGEQYRGLLQMHPQINVLGGCCGTDHRHVEAIARLLRQAQASRGLRGVK